MNYSAMIQIADPFTHSAKRKFRARLSASSDPTMKDLPRLVPEIATELIVLDKDAQPALESSAGYKQFSSEHRTTCSLCLPRIPTQPSTPAT